MPCGFESPSKVPTTSPRGRETSNLLKYSLGMSQNQYFGEASFECIITRTY